VHDKTPYGQGLADETKKAMNAAGVTEVMYEGVNIGDKDFSALIGKMKEAGVSIIYWGGLHTEAGLIIRQAADQGLKATLVSGDGIVSNRVGLDRWRRGCRHAEHVRPGSDAEPGEQGNRGEVQGRRLQPGSLYALLLRRRAGDRWRCCRQVERPGRSCQGYACWHLPDRARRDGLRRKGDPKLPGYIMYEWVRGDDGKYTYKPQG
jgi:branched-chain amino acid transport system substrate-binding protein